MTDRELLDYQRCPKYYEFEWKVRLAAPPSFYDAIKEGIWEGLKTPGDPKAAYAAFKTHLAKRLLDVEQHPVHPKRFMGQTAFDLFYIYANGVHAKFPPLETNKTVCVKGYETTIPILTAVGPISIRFGRYKPGVQARRGDILAALWKQAGFGRTILVNMNTRSGKVNPLFAAPRERDVDRCMAMVGDIEKAIKLGAFPRTNPGRDICTALLCKFWWACTRYPKTAMKRGCDRFDENE